MQKNEPKFDFIDTEEKVADKRTRILRRMERMRIISRIMFMTTLLTFAAFLIGALGAPAITAVETIEIGILSLWALIVTLLGLLNFRLLTQDLYAWDNRLMLIRLLAKKVKR